MLRLVILSSSVSCSCFSVLAHSLVPYHDFFYHFHLSFGLLLLFFCQPPLLPVLSSSGFPHSRFTSHVSRSILVHLQQLSSPSSSPFPTRWGQRPKFLISRMFCPGHPPGNNMQSTLCQSTNLRCWTLTGDI